MVIRITLLLLWWVVLSLYSLINFLLEEYDSALYFGVLAIQTSIVMFISMYVEDRNR